MIQLFLQYPHLKKLVGVELAVTRGVRGMFAAQKLAQLYPKRFVSQLPLIRIILSSDEWIWIWNMKYEIDLHVTIMIVPMALQMASHSNLTRVNRWNFDVHKSYDFLLDCRIIWIWIWNSNLYRLKNWNYRKVAIGIHFVYLFFFPLMSYVHRSLELRRQNMFECTDALDADIIICETVSQHSNSHIWFMAMIFIFIILLG